LELLAYKPPGRARSPSSGATDLSTDWTTLAGVMAGSAEEGAAAGAARAAEHGRGPALLKKATALTDPDGHRFVLVRHGTASLGSPA
jgi:hypothetical protein